MDTPTDMNTPSENPEQPSTGFSQTWAETIGPEATKALALRAEIEQARAKLCPAPRELAAKALTSALILCAPAGFSEGDRTAWLKAALDTVRDVPADLLKWGIEQARITADHPSKIIPAIMAHVGDRLTMRRQHLRRVETLSKPALPSPGNMSCTADEAAKIIEEECPWVSSETKATITRPLGPPRRPTRADYIEMGVDPAVLDGMG